MELYTNESGDLLQVPSEDELVDRVTCTGIEGFEDLLDISLYKAYDSYEAIHKQNEKGSVNKSSNSIRRRASLFSNPLHHR